MIEIMDKKDYHILYHLCEDARTSHNKLAKEVTLSKSALRYRIERLKQKNIISGFFTIIDLGKLGYSSYNLLLRLNYKIGREKDFIEFITSQREALVVDRLIGEWHFLVELAYKETIFFNDFINKMKEQFSDVIDTYELHPTLVSYKIEQFPIEIGEEKKRKKEIITKDIKVDSTDIKLLSELNEDSTQQLISLAKKLSITYETVATRIKNLKKKGIIKKFTAKINLIALGYEVYLIILDLRNFSKEKEKNLESYLNSQKNIRYSFLSASVPKIFTYLAVKNAKELNSFLMDVKEKFSDIIINQHYLLSTEQLKYSLYPK